MLTNDIEKEIIFANLHLQDSQELRTNFAQNLHKKLNIMWKCLVFILQCAAIVASSRTSWSLNSLLPLLAPHSFEIQIENDI